MDSITSAQKNNINQLGPRQCNAPPTLSCLRGQSQELLVLVRFALARVPG